MTSSSAERLLRFHDAVRLTHTLIDPAYDADKRPEALRERATLRMQRLRSFLSFLGDPHLAVPVIHVGGTSGKGSTATMIAAIARATGLRVGLHVSPYLQSPTEKLQIDGRLIAPDHFSNLVDRLLAEVERWGQGPLTYGEFWMALTTTAFAEAGLDLAVIEVGAGGRFDLTNVVQPVVSVITSVGMDHVEILGPTLADIAWHKAGIIKPGTPIVTAVREPVAYQPIEAEALAVGAPLTVIDPPRDVGADRHRTTFSSADGRWETGLGGRFQATNARLAIAALDAVPSITLSSEAISTGLASARLPGRAEHVQQHPDVLLDGAHNAQKIDALVDDLDLLMPRSDGGRRHCLVGLLATKDADGILAQLIPHCDAITFTAPSVLAKPAADPHLLAEQARALGCQAQIAVIPEPKEALEAALDALREDDALLVTGSLYLLGNLRGHWYPDDEVILKQTSWPSPHAGAPHSR